MEITSRSISYEEVVEEADYIRYRHSVLSKQRQQLVAKSCWSANDEVRARQLDQTIRKLEALLELL